MLIFFKKDFQKNISHPRVGEDHNLGPRLKHSGTTLGSNSRLHVFQVRKSAKTRKNDQYLSSPNVFVGDLISDSRLRGNDITKLIVFVALISLIFSSSAWAGRGLIGALDEISNEMDSS